MVDRKDPIKELARFLAQTYWSHDRLEVAIRAVCEGKGRPGNPSLAVACYEREHRRLASGVPERVRVRVKVRKRRKRKVAR